MRVGIRNKLAPSLLIPQWSCRLSSSDAVERDDPPFFEVSVITVCCRGFLICWELKRVYLHCAVVSMLMKMVTVVAIASFIIHLKQNVN